MGWAQTISGVLLVIALLVVGGYFLWSQWRALDSLARETTLPPDEHLYHRRQAYRRFTAGVLILMLAVMLVGAFLFLEAPAQALADERDSFPDPETRPPLTEQQRIFARMYGLYWLFFLLLLLALVMIGAWDYLALRRFSRTQRRQIQEDRKAMIAQQARRLRRDRPDELLN